MHLRAKAVLMSGAAALALAVTAFAPALAQAQDAEPIHIALADLPEVETLFFLVGLARAGERASSTSSPSSTARSSRSRRSSPARPMSASALPMP